MKKFVCLFCLLLCLLLTACGDISFESNDHHFTIKFPEEMLVVSPGKKLPDNPLLKDFSITDETMKAYSEQGGVVYAIGKTDGVYTEISVNVDESDYTKEVWALKNNDMATAKQLQEDIIETFNAGGIEVTHKGEFMQGRTFCVYVNACNNQNHQIDAVYMATIYNGKQYSVLYQSNKPLGEAGEQAAFDVFNTFYIQKTLRNPADGGRNTTKLQAVLIILMLLIFMALIAVIIRMVLMARNHKQSVEERPYVPQFEDTLKNTRKKDRNQ